MIVERWFRTLRSECLRNEEYETPADWYFSGVAEAA